MPNAGRTVNGIPRMAQKQADDPRLRLFGAVDLEQVLTPDDLKDLPRGEFIGGMNCNESGRRPDARWTGVPLAELLRFAGASPETLYVNVSAGPYAAAIERDRADDVILADRLDDAPIGVDQGGPWRLIVPDGKLYNSVKWVDAIEFSIDSPNDASERIALARARAREKHAANQNGATAGRQG